jgi:RNA polymerase sigma factor (sigma-70 family)
MEIDLDRLVERCKANDHKAFEVLYKRYYRVLLGIALRYAGNLSEAEDVLQDSFIKVFHSIGSYSGKGSFEGWLKRIVQNTAINSYRSRIKFDLYVDLSDQEDKISDDGLSAVFEKLNTKDAIGLLNSMPEGYRLVINLYFIDGYSHKEIAEMLNITPGTSKSQLFKAKNYLRNLVETTNHEKIV